MRAREETPVAATQWEYARLILGAESTTLAFSAPASDQEYAGRTKGKELYTIAILGELGLLGWEVCAAHSGGVYSTLYIYLKRPVTTST